MLQRYALWKYLVVLFATVFGFVYSVPNFFRPDPAVQISGQSSSRVMDQAALDRAAQALQTAGIDIKAQELTGKSLLLRLHRQDDQLRAKALIGRALGGDYVVALNLASTTPGWLAAIGATPMKLGLDLSGGVHFVMEVDTRSAVKNRLDVNLGDIKRKLREERIHGQVSMVGGQKIEVRFSTEELRSKAADALAEAVPGLQRVNEERGSSFITSILITPEQIKEMEDYAVTQNLTTLRNRVNELGVAEPLIQKLGRNRIVVELPGVQDTAEAKRILGKTASLEFRLEARPDASAMTSEEFEFRDAMAGQLSALLERDIIISGERVTSASSGFDPESSQPQVNISLDGQGGRLMNRATQDNIQRKMGVLFIERKARVVDYKKDEDGNDEPITEPYEERKIISLATIQSALGTQFRITGLDSPAEASELALLLRAGALAAPMDFVEESTIGPSLGAENISLGLRSMVYGAVFVVIFMLVVYRAFGLFANLALLMNVVILLALLSMLSATLTLPGMAGIVLTMGMAVDANVLINSRIREELANGLTPHAAIQAGYERAWVTIFDSNITTLIIGVILYVIGTGPVRGFAVVLSLGILTSMFTAVMGSRVFVNLAYGRRRVTRLSI